MSHGGKPAVHGMAKLSTSMLADVAAGLEINRLTKSSTVRQGDKVMEKNTTTKTDLTVRTKGTLAITLGLAITFMAAGLMFATHG